MVTVRRGLVSPVLLSLLALAVAGCSASPPAKPASSSSSPTTARSRAATAAAGSAVAYCPATGASATVTVRSAKALKRALANSQPGQEIILAPGTYVGNFSVTHSGSPAAPVTLCGSRDATLDGGDLSHGYVLHLDHASWWRIEGFTVEDAQKGVVADGSDHDLFDGLYVHSTGDEGIHLRSFSSDDVISHCLIRDTGQKVAFFGEGVYVGSAHKNWCRYSGCRPDASDDDLIEYNNIADTTAENVDIKEGTTGGRIIGNTFDGTGMVATAATAWVNVKGNDWTIAENTGTTSIKDGFQVHQVYPGWGMSNVFRGNKAEVNGPGYGIYVQSKRLRTIVFCDNQVMGAGRGFSNIACMAA
jgi:hypothetical protein